VSVVVIIPEGEAPPVVLPMPMESTDTIAMLKQKIDSQSEGKRPADRQVILSWGQQLEDSVEMSQLNDTSTSVTLLMKSEQPLSSLVMEVASPASGMQAGNRANSTNAIVQMLRQIQEMQPRQQAPLPQPDPEAMTELMSMGFPEVRCKKALLLNGNNVEAAIEWIFTNQDSPDVDEPLTSFQIARLAATPNTFRSTAQQAAAARTSVPAAADPAVQASANQFVEQFDELLQQIARGAHGDQAQRQAVEARLPELESHGWRLTSPVHQLWNGERNVATLSAGADVYSAALIARMVEHTTNINP